MLADDPAALGVAVSLLRRGELVAFPTDTVYGVGAIAWDDEAVGKLYEAKIRPADKPIPVLLSSPAELELVARDLTPSALALAEHFWPGPLTLVVRRSTRLPYSVTAGSDTVAVRVPDHPVALSLIRAAGAPLATTSANLSGQAAGATAAEVAAQLAGRIALILDGGACPGGVPSTIADVTGDEIVILRKGPLDIGRLREVFWDG
jgi:L-threonylcarbamoyladenylate synthase